GGGRRPPAPPLAETAGRGGLGRRVGELRRVPAGWRRREVDFGDGPVLTVTIPWGDVSTAYHSTGIPDVEVYAAASRGAVGALRASRLAGPILSTRPVQRMLKAWIRRRPPGPDRQARERGEARVWGEVEDERGRRAIARLRTPEGYTLTARSAVAIVERVLRGELVPGFQTPSRVYGPDLILEFDGVTREDVAA
ncbi:MAG: saccharopine dehydrogenase, partial [Gemmatimonadota bacterium]